MDEPRVPSYYVVSRSLTEEQLARVQQALALTPISHVIVTDVHDMKVGMQFSHMMIRTDTEDRAKEMAGESKSPVVVIGHTVFADAYYEDGTHDALPT